VTRCLAEAAPQLDVRMSDAVAGEQELAAEHADRRVAEDLVGDLESSGRSAVRPPEAVRCQVPDVGPRILLRGQRVEEETVAGARERRGPRCVVARRSAQPAGAGRGAVGAEEGSPVLGGLRREDERIAQGCLGQRAGRAGAGGEVVHRRRAVDCAIGAPELRELEVEGLRAGRDHHIGGGAGLDPLELMGACRRAVRLPDLERDGLSSRDAEEGAVTQRGDVEDVVEFVLAVEIEDPLRRRGCPLGPPEAARRAVLLRNEEESAGERRERVATEERGGCRKADRTVRGSVGDDHVVVVLDEQKEETVPHPGLRSENLDLRRDEVAERLDPHRAGESAVGPPERVVGEEERVIAVGDQSGQPGERSGAGKVERSGAGGRAVAAPEGGGGRAGDREEQPAADLLETVRAAQLAALEGAGGLDERGTRGRAIGAPELLALPVQGEEKQGVAGVDQVRRSAVARTRTDVAHPVLGPRRAVGLPQLAPREAVVGGEIQLAAGECETVRSRAATAGADVGQPIGPGVCAVAAPELLAMGRVGGQKIQDAVVGQHQAFIPDQQGRARIGGRLGVQVGDEVRRGGCGRDRQGKNGEEKGWDRSHWRSSQE